MGQGLAGGQNNLKKFGKALDKCIDKCYISYVEDEEIRRIYELFKSDC